MRSFSELLLYLFELSLLQNCSFLAAPKANLSSAQYTPRRRAALHLCATHHMCALFIMHWIALFFCCCVRCWFLFGERVFFIFIFSTISIIIIREDWFFVARLDALVLTMRVRFVILDILFFPACAGISSCRCHLCPQPVWVQFGWVVTHSFALASHANRTMTRPNTLGLPAGRVLWLRARELKAY